MTIDQLQYFMALSKHKNFTIAAEECYISQSSLSKQIKSLETELGNVELFDRSTKNLSITYAGKEFYIFANKVLLEYEKILKSMNECSHGHVDVINLGTIPVINHYGLTDTFFNFQEDYPNIRVKLFEANSTPIVEAFDKGKIDIAILRDNYLPVGDYTAFTLAKDQLVFITNHSHWLSEYNEIDLKIAENENFLFLASNTGMLKSCRCACKKSGFIPKEQVLNVRSNTIKNLVANSQGVSLMMNKSIRYMNDPRIKIINLKEPYTINLTLIVRNDVINEAISTFIEYITDSFALIL